MKERFRWWMVPAALAVLFVLIQFVPYGVSDPSTRDEPKWDSPKTRELAVSACYDCHSNETKVMWFEQVAPVKWYIANHVKEGRAKLNFSEWNTNAGEGTDEIVDQVKEGGMPPAYYHYFGLHSGQKLTAAESAQLAAGLEKTIAADPPKGGEGGGEGGQGGGGDGDKDGD